MVERSLPYEAFGLFLKNARQAAGFERQSDLADKIGASQQAVSSWEAGRSRPRQSQISALANSLSLAPAKLIEAGGYQVVTEALPEKATVSFDQDFPVDALSPESFERLVEELVRRKYPDAREVRRAGGRGHSQGGIDIFAVLGDGRQLVVQCKRVTRFGPAEVNAVVKAYVDAADIKNSCFEPRCQPRHGVLSANARLAIVGQARFVAAAPRTRPSQSDTDC